MSSTICPQSPCRSCAWTRELRGFDDDDRDLAGGLQFVAGAKPGTPVSVATQPVCRRVVDATYLSPSIPATTPPPFGVADGVRVMPVIWLLANGVEPDRIMWVRLRDPWMLNRAKVQPDPAVAFGLAADIMAAGSDAESLDDLFLRLEAASVMFRIDPRPTDDGEGADAR